MTTSPQKRKATEPSSELSDVPSFVLDAKVTPHDMQTMAKKRHEAHVLKLTELYFGFMASKIQSNYVRKGQVMKIMRPPLENGTNEDLYHDVMDKVFVYLRQLGWTVTPTDYGKILIYD